MTPSDYDSSGRPARVLVLAPHFPAINQPWIDTYLEELVRHGVSFGVLTWNQNPKHYSEKVDKLDLRSYAIIAPSSWRQILLQALRSTTRPDTPFLRALFLTRSACSHRSELRRSFGQSLRSLAALAVLRRFPHTSVIHSHSEFMSSAFLEAMQALAVPLVVTFHGLPPKGVTPISPRRRRKIAAYASTVLVNTEFAREQAIRVGYQPETIRILPQGLPLEDFPARGEALQRDHHGVRILSVGRFHRDKGQGYALLALARLARNGRRVQWRFVGAGPDRERLQRLAARLGISSQAQFEGGLPLDQLLRRYQESDLFVLASVPSTNPDEHVETQGVVLQEAQASGCIPVASRVGGIPECVTDRSDGWLVQPRSHRAIAAAIETLIQRREQWPKIRKLGRRNVENRFSARMVGETMVEILECVADESLRTTVAHNRASE